ncbi:hypothetical protein [Phascolarctobacterium faecium]|uniref:hypothetical protein n=1 Tax=Phascolarctobacterium faecium TaxID=33025 RepID=UPI0030799A5A
MDLVKIVMNVVLLVGIKEREDVALEYKVVYQYSNDPELRQHSETVDAVVAIDAMNKVETMINAKTKESFEIMAVILNGRVIK